MRWHAGSGLLLLVLALAEASLLPAVLGDAVRPSLVLIAASVWVAVRGRDGFVWAFAGGLMLDLMSSVPVGLFSFSYLIGNAVATMLDRAPIPSAALRASTWVALAGVVSQGVMLAGLALAGWQIDIIHAMTSVVLPLLLINPALALPAYFILNRLSLRRRQRVL